MFEAAHRILHVKELRSKIAATLGLLIIYRLGKFIPTPGIDFEKISEFMTQATSGGGAASAALSMADMLSGGALMSGAIFGLGIMPYISASIIFQLLVAIVPSLSRIAHEGATGRKKITQYTRLATVALCLVQATMMCKIMISFSQGENGGGLLSANVSPMEFYFYGVFSITVGTMFLMWLGEQIDEFGIGNGISILIMAGIISRLPTTVKQMMGSFNQADGMPPAKLVAILAIFVLMTLAVVLITLGTRRVPIQQSKATRGRKVYGGQRNSLPLKVNQAGVIPIIFAQSIMYVPPIALEFFDDMAGTSIKHLFGMGTFWYTVFYVLLIMFFCYFYTAITFNPNEMADNLKQSGMYLPGIRPGKRTANHLEKIMTRIALAGSVFLAFIAIVPQFIVSAFGIDYGLAGMLGGTGLLIVVGVALDVVQRIESHLLMRDYEGFGVSGGKVRGRKQ